MFLARYVCKLPSHSFSLAYNVLAEAWHHQPCECWVLCQHVPWRPFKMALWLSTFPIHKDHPIPHRLLFLSSIHKDEYNISEPFLPFSCMITLACQWDGEQGWHGPFLPQVGMTLLQLSWIWGLEFILQRQIS